MKKILTGAVLLTSLVFSGNVDSETLKKIKTLKPLDAKEVTVKSAKKVGTIIVLNLLINEARGKRAVPAVVTEDFKHVIIGSAYETKTGKIESTIEMKKLGLVEAFTRGKSNKNGTFYVFTDPDCPACKSFDSNMKNELDKAGIQIKIMFFPLDRIHPEARKKSEYILDFPETDRKNAYEKLRSGDTAWKDAKPSDKAVKQVEKMVEVGKELGLRGTPSIYGEKGNAVEIDVFYAYLRALKKKEKGEVK